jgi:hypothetical protein
LVSKLKLFTCLVQMAGVVEVGEVEVTEVEDAAVDEVAVMTA